MMKHILPFALLAIALLPFCKSTQITNAPKPMEQYNTAEEVPLLSTLSIPINIPVADLVRSSDGRTLTLRRSFGTVSPGQAVWSGLFA